MRYLIEYTLANVRPLHSGVEIATTFCAVEADDPDHARAQLMEAHPDRVPVSIRPAADQNRCWYGMGYLTDPELEAHAQVFHTRASEESTSKEQAAAQVSVYSLDEFAARTTYAERRAAEEAQNEEGYHVGDLLYCRGGYSMILYSFFQVVALKGKHTIIVQQLNANRHEYASMKGVLRAVRDSFKSSKAYTIRTNTPDCDGKPAACAPSAVACCYGRAYLRPCADGQLFYDDTAD